MSSKKRTCSFLYAIIKAISYKKAVHPMRFLHLSDLHLGKRVCEFSMLDDQRYILEPVSYTHLTLPTN